MSALFRAVGFSVAMILMFASVTYVLPQVKGEAPEEEEMDLGELTMDSFVEMGEKLYQGKGTCTLCHNSLGRAPDLLTYNVQAVSLERIADDRYQGKAGDAESYLRESMKQPSAYVVEGFGKKGSNDTESPMPAVDQPPTQLSDIEIDGIIAFLQKKDGNPVTVALPSADAAPAVDTGPAAAPALAQTAEEAIAKFGCAACHAILESVSPVGPSLKDVGTRLPPDKIRSSIIDPKADIAPGFPPIMPEFPNMALAELELVVEFLSRQTGSQP
ncbi:MAG: cytochrome C [Gammaproteobacteria bacterium]|nr:cytochrome C [Gammaproteobacteria bacterium]MDH3450539.1 cytochrome C [Gammaproteobacteria bacterium]